MSADPNHISIFEFDIKGKVIGTGAYSEIILAKRYRDRKNYALKVVNKEKAMRANNVKYLLNERKVMLLLNHPRIIKLLWTSKDDKCVYFFYELAKNGELWELLRGFPKLSPPVNIVKLWVSQVVDALQYLHLVHKVAHRDIKPENIVLDENWNLKLCDFGTSKVMSPEILQLEYEKQIQTIIEVTKRVDAQEKIRLAKLRAAAASGPSEDDQDDNTDDSTRVRSDNVLSDEEHRRRSILYQSTRNNSFTGTPQYMAPEVIKNRSSRGMASDLWALGILIYQLHTGKLPFNGDSAYLTFESVLAHNIDWSLINDPIVGDIVRQLLQVDPMKRLGVVVDDGQLSAYKTVIQQHNSLQVEEEKRQEKLEESKSASHHQQGNNNSDTNNNPDQIPGMTKLYTEKDIQRLHQYTVYPTQEGYGSLMSHPYFNSIPFPSANDMTTLPPPPPREPYTTAPDTISLCNDIPTECFDELTHAKEQCKDNIQYIDEHGNVVMTAKMKRQLEIEKEQREAEKLVEEAFSSDFPMLDNNLDIPSSSSSSGEDDSVEYSD